MPTGKITIEENVWTEITGIGESILFIPNSDWFEFQAGIGLSAPVDEAGHGWPRRKPFYVSSMSALGRFWVRSPDRRASLEYRVVHASTWDSVAANAYVAPGDPPPPPPPPPGGGTTITNPVAPLTGLIASDISAFDNDAYNKGAGWSVSGGIATRDGASSASNLDLPGQSFTANNEFAVTFDLLRHVSGSAQIQFGGGFAQNAQGASLVGSHVRELTAAAAGSTIVRFTGTGGLDGDVDNLQVFDVTELKARRAHIVILAGQSNMVGSSTDFPELGVDSYDTRVLMLPGVSNNTWDIDAGVVKLASDPLNHYHISNVVSNGVGPGMSIARHLADYVSEDECILLVCCAHSGSGLVGSGALWNPTSTASPNAYDNAVSMIQTAMARNGGDIGQVMMFWSQGETDAGATQTAAYAADWAAMYAQLKTDIGVSSLPTVIMGLLPDTSDSRYDALNTVQAGLATDPDVTFVPGPTGFNSGDDVHYTREGNRQRGTDAGEAMRQLLNWQLA